MLGNGVEMMKKFIEVSGFTNSESPAIFIDVHKALDKKLKRIEKIKAIYADDGDEAPMTKCPQCGSPTLVVHNCEFCGYAMIDYDASSEGTVDDAQPATKVEEAPTRTSCGKTEPTKEEITDTKTEEVKEETPTRTSRVKASSVPSKEEINKARRPGLKKFADTHGLSMSSDMAKAELKDIRIELLEKLFGESTPVAEKKTNVATKKDVVIDFSKAPDNKTLEGMDEAGLITVIRTYNLPIPKTLKALEGELSDNGFFICIDEIIASLISEEAKQSTVKEEAKEPTRARASRTKKEEVVKEVVNLIRVDDLPSVKELEELSEVKLLEVVAKFGLYLKEDKVVQLKKGGLQDDIFFGIVDIVNAGLGDLADDINNGGKVAYPVIEETKKNVRTKKAPASEPKLEEGNEIDSNCEDIDLDNADINYDDINIEDLAEA